MVYIVCFGMFVLGLYCGVVLLPRIAEIRKARKIEKDALKDDIIENKATED